MSKTIAMKDGDFFVAPNGQLLEVEGELKADQDFAEALLQPYDERDDTGNELNDLSTTNLGPFAASLNGIVAEKIREAVARLQKAQSRDPAVSVEEKIVGIGRLIVKNGERPGDYYYYVEGLLPSGGKVTGQKQGFKFEPSITQAEP